MTNSASKWASLFLSVLLLSLPANSQAQESTSPIGDGSTYVCLYYDWGYSMLGIIVNGDLRETLFRRHLRKAKRSKRRTIRKLRRAQRQGEIDKIEYFQNLLNSWTAIVNDMIECRDYIADDPDYGWDPDDDWDNWDPDDDWDDWDPDDDYPDTDPTPTPAPTPGDGGNVSNACSIFGSSSRSDISARIINGSTCSVGDSPVVELVMYDTRGGNLGSCSGTAITATAILTASHCLADGSNGERVGSVQVITGFGSQTSTSFYSHPSWDPYGWEIENHDVALVLLSQALGVRTMPLLAQNDFVDGEQVAIAGYGQTESGTYDELRAGFMTLNSHTSESLVALYNGGGSNTCFGDSGGPLAVLRGGIWYLAGTTSNGDNQTCGTDGSSDTSRWANVTSAGNKAFIQQYVSGVFN